MAASNGLESWQPYGHPCEGFILTDATFLIDGKICFVTAEQQLERMTPERRAEVEAMFCNGRAVKGI